MPEPISLCEYFWRVISAITLSPIMLMLVFAGFFVMVIFFAYDWLLERYLKYKNKVNTNSDIPKFKPRDNIVVSYFVAKKNKICPRVEYLDE